MSTSVQPADVRRRSGVVPLIAALLVRPELCLAAVELFAVSNLAFLALDVYIAHSTNSFALSAEWIPVGFSLLAPALLALSMRLQRGICPPQLNANLPRERAACWLGIAAGAGAILVGVAGLLWHLESHFFEEATLESLVYTAPFVAPLSYTGVGLLMVLNRMVASRSHEWGRWVVLLALGGFVGNFVLSLADHAQNGFFEWREWIPVVASALAVGNLSTVAFVDCSPATLKRSALVMLMQIAVGMLGWYYHFRAMIGSRMDSLWDKVVYSAPIFAPLLFADLALLALIGLWSLALYPETEATA
jgi:hypothetical protein